MGEVKLFIITDEGIEWDRCMADGYYSNIITDRMEELN